MVTWPLAVGILLNGLLVLWVLISILLILIVLIQKAKGGGLSSAFGGMGASSLLGTKTGDVLTWVTISLAAIFLGLGAILVKVYRPSEPAGLKNPPAVAPDTATPGSGDTATTPIPGDASTPQPTGDNAAARQPAASTPTEPPATPASAPAQPTPTESAPTNPSGN